MTWWMMSAASASGSGCNASVVALDHRGDAFAHPVVRDLGWSVLLDPGLRLHHLGHGPEADAVAVGESSALAPPHELGHVADALEELGDEARLADAGNADDG